MTTMWSRGVGSGAASLHLPDCGIVDFVGRDHDAVEAAAADDVNLAVERGGADRAARPLHRRQRAPSVGSAGSYSKAPVPAPLCTDADEAAEGVDLAVEHGDAEMIAPLRQRRARAPAIGRRVVFVVIGARGPAHRAADRVQLAVERGGRDFGARRRQRRLHGPVAG